MWQPARCAAVNHIKADNSSQITHIHVSGGSIGTVVFGCEQGFARLRDSRRIIASCDAEPAIYWRLVIMSAPGSAWERGQGRRRVVVVVNVTTDTSY